ncbi:MAG: hypothetical protein IJI14_14135 [Anaerolineaceae bacterium]|nr:hypothetical protein [Anaerolineaceae bacterium]
MGLIHLSEICKENWKLPRDGEFASLGLCSAHAGMPLLTFCGNVKFLRMALKNPDISCVMIPQELEEQALAMDIERGFCVVPNVRIDFFELHNRLCSPEWAARYVGTDSPTVIDPTAQIDPRAIIAPENVTIGANTVIEAGAVIYGRTMIGSNCIIRSGTILGGSGLEFIRMGNEGMLGVEHRGSLIIGDRVEIQYNCNVSRSLFPWHETRIGNDTKVESLVHIAHGSHIGERVLIAASACVCGSAEIRNDVWIGPNATVSSEVKIGDQARVNLGAVAASDIPAGTVVTGNFAVRHDLFMADHLNKLRGNN